MVRPRYVPLFAAISHSERLADLPDDSCRFFYLALLPQCDEWGRCSARARVLNATVWPMLGKTIAEVERALIELERVGLISRHWRGSDEYLAIPDWEDKAGQLGKRDHRRESEWPDPSFESGQSGPVRANAGQSGPTRAITGQDGPSLAGACACTRAPARAQPRASNLISSDLVSSQEGCGEESNRSIPVDPDTSPPVPVPVRRPPKPPAVGEVLAEPEFAVLSAHEPFRAFWEGTWLPHRRETGKSYKPRGAREALRQAVLHGPDVWVAAARQSMANGWQGVFPERMGGKPPDGGQDRLQRYAQELADGIRQRAGGAA